MKKIKTTLAGVFLTAAIIASVYIFFIKEKSVNTAGILASFDKDGTYELIPISYPHNETLFPPDIIAPIFTWQDDSEGADRWLVHLDFNDGKSSIDAIAENQEWEPAVDEWEKIKKRSLENPAQVTILGFAHEDLNIILSKGALVFTTSKDSVAAPIFYREVNLPFESAVKDPTKIRWRFGSVSTQEQPPVILENMPVCGNCHSFSLEGKKMGLDVDYANDKGSYAFTDVEPEIPLSEENIITWSSYKKEDNVNTFGLLSQVSPDGKYVVSTVKDRSVFVAKPELAFSQLFFPIKGILAYYDSESKTFHALPGADNKKYVQSNATWSPDGKYIVFARSKAYKLKNLSNNDKVLLTDEECAEFLKGEKDFLYDLYRIPFNQGKGGTAVPLKGASFNGMSNFFAKYSPDGKWIVFCQAKSYMLLQPDSELYIMPAEGGEARRMRCNTDRMNSWHSWSPNSKWLVFSSKENSVYTQLFLTHIDEQGVSSPPVLLKQFTNSRMAANIPEFVNSDAAAIETIQKDFLTDDSYLRAGNEALVSKDFKIAEKKYKKALELNEDNINANIQLAVVLTSQRKLDEAEIYCKKAIQLDPENAQAFFHLGEALCLKGDLVQSIENLNISAQYDPDFPATHYVLGQAKEKQKKYSEAIEHYKHFIKLYPTSFNGYYHLIGLLLQQDELKKALKYSAQAESLKKENTSFLLGNLFRQYNQLDHANNFYKNAIKADPKNPEPMCNLAANLFKQGKHKEALYWYNKALAIKADIIPALVASSSILLTSPDVTLHDSKKAIELAKKACEFSDYKSEIPLNMLALGYAQTGQYEQAVATSERALVIAQSKKNYKLCQQIQTRIALYKNNM